VRILYISHKPIYPKVDGGCAAMANFLDLLLANGNDVKHLTLNTNKHSFDRSAYPSKIVDKTHVESVFVNTDIQPFKAITELFKTGSYNVNRFYSNEMNAKIGTLLKNESFDSVILESLYCTSYLRVIRANFNGKVLLRSHNVEFQIWEDLTKNCTNWVKKLYFKKLTRDLKQYEIETVGKIDGIMTISKDDERYFKSVASALPVKTIGYALNTNNSLTNDYSASNLFHIGGMDWKPNREAVQRLIRLFPRIKSQNSDIEVHLFGNGTVELQPNNASIKLHGFVNDLEKQCISTGILVSPLTSGSGIRIKILEMMAIGIPVITTKKGAQGIQYEDKKCLMLAETDEEIVSACVELTQNAKLRAEIGENAQRYIFSYHSPKTVSKQLDEFLHAT